MALRASSNHDISSSVKPLEAGLGAVTPDKIGQGIEQITRGKPQAHILVAPHRKLLTVGTVNGDLVDRHPEVVGLKVKF